ncbi:MAG: branched-chain amino acid ABC transporter permease [Gemmatimonadota bacterium]
MTARAVSRRPVREAAAAAAVFAAVAVLPVALSFNPYYLSIFVGALILGAVSVAWNLLAGVCGQVSFGHAAFFGVGAYASAILSTKAGWNPYAAMAVSGAAGVAAALLIGLPAFRLRGPYFALAILAFAEAMKLLAVNLDGLTEGSRGIYDIPPPPTVRFFGAALDFRASRTANYYLAALLLLAVYLAVAFVRRSNAGLAMSAVHGDEETAAGIGVPVVRTKALALSISGFLTALTGSFYAHYVRVLSPESAFDASWSIMPIVGSLFGGMGTLVGPSVGAIVITALDEFLFKGLFATGHKLFFGLVLAVVIVWAPSGLLGRRVARTPYGGKR